jgi:integrase
MSDTTTTSGPAKFTKAKDSRGREVEGLWIRNDRFYYQLYVASKQRCQLVPLMDDEEQPIRTLQKAQEAAVLLRQKRSEGETPQARRAPFFPDFYKYYITWLEETEAKSDLTIRKEESALKGWSKALGSVRVTQITPSDVNSYVLERRKSGSSARTANLDVIALSNCLERAKKDGWIKGKLPTENYEALKYTPPKRPLFTREEIDALCAEAVRMTDGTEPKCVYLTGELLSDWLRLMQWSGARHTAAISAKWDQVDFTKKQLTLYTKNDKTVVVDFNENLEAHLKSMRARKSDSPFLFPSCRSDGEEGHLTRLYKSLLKVKTGVAKKFPRMSDFTPHDLRHFFISWCCEKGIDFLIIKEWVGHSDTKLIANTYGHVGNEHRASAVKKLSAPEPAKQENTIDLTKVKPEELLKALQQLTAKAA